MLGKFLFFSSSCMAALLDLYSPAVLCDCYDKSIYCVFLNRTKCPTMFTSQPTNWALRTVKCQRDTQDFLTPSRSINQVVTMLIHNSGKKFPDIFNDNYGYSRFAREFIFSASVANIVNKTKEENWIPVVVELWKCCSEHCGNVVGKLSKIFFPPLYNRTASACHWAMCEFDIRKKLVLNGDHADIKWHICMFTTTSHCCANLNNAITFYFFNFFKQSWLSTFSRLP